MESEDCDEKRCYTPEPRDIVNIEKNKINKLNHSMIGLRSVNSGG